MAFSVLASWVASAYVLYNYFANGKMPMNLHPAHLIWMGIAEVTFSILGGLYAESLGLSERFAYSNGVAPVLAKKYPNQFAARPNTPAPLAAPAPPHS